MLLRNILIAIVSLLILALSVAGGQAASRPATVADIALYRGPDREQMLIEGAKKEGQMLFYNSNTWMAVVAQEFEKKYPGIKISIWRSDPTAIIKRVMEEYGSGRFLVDLIETNPEFLAVLHMNGVLQERYSPEASHYGDEVKVKGKTGVFYLGDREYYTGLGFNTKQVSPAEAPKTYQQLLDPKWKGKISIAGESIGPRWIGVVLEAMGRDYLDKLSRQDVKVQNMAPVALLDLVVSGEVPLSPTIGDPNVFTAKQKGAPVEWIPLEPAMVSVGSSGMATKAAHPHTALLFLDYLNSKQGQQLVLKGGLSSPRDDVISKEIKFKKSYFGIRLSPDEYEKKYDEWEKLMIQLFVKKR